MRIGIALLANSTDASARGPLAERSATAASRPMPLIPLHPPGRVTRKARQYLDQIVQLRDQGYSCETIQQALSAVGVEVSVSTVRREARRRGELLPADAHDSGAEHPPGSAPSSTDSDSAISRAPRLHTEASGPTTGKDLAEAYARGRSNTPLVRAKEQSS